jgi:hypothetical protein
MIGPWIGGGLHRWGGHRLSLVGARRDTAATPARAQLGMAKL